jgi:hypothetical protein
MGNRLACFQGEDGEHGPDFAGSHTVRMTVREHGYRTEKMDSHNVPSRAGT